MRAFVIFLYLYIKAYRDSNFYHFRITMYLRFTLYTIFLFIPRICSNNTSTSNNLEVVVSNKTERVSESSTIKVNKTKVEMLSEGGSILPALPLLPVLPLPKEENHTNLISLDKEIGKTKEKPVVPRKGVVYNPSEDLNITAKVDSHKDRVDTTVTKSPILNDTVKNLEVVVPSSKTNINKTSLHNVTETTTNVPKKPLVLSYEALSAVGKQNDNVQSTKIETSSKNIVTDQLPTPNVKVHNISTNRHPGMVMPIVITMLVVPMFAVLGYMALKRGQEAWKNRHYKRMDFLLDGMYND